MRFGRTPARLPHYCSTCSDSTGSGRAVSTVRGSPGDGREPVVEETTVREAEFDPNGRADGPDFQECLGGGRPSPCPVRGHTATAAPVVAQ
ncbi:hypothetical protein [Streptomyces chiangmaiensis]|uniref:Uncharacterized protein n=1 Tax=Streptomyces chiangmaiensis TaxID=766497 RepID=A0ABU7F9X4_9ACTN|nr:hypothetical protein [Streptomyces chiangmaiensis]MED7820991.1 hypothetical protein [Streptomyces chiangmaiensis]